MSNLTQILQKVDTMHSVFTDMLKIMDRKELMIAEVINWYERNRLNIKAYWDSDYHFNLNEEQRRERGNLCKKMEENRKELIQLVGREEENETETLVETKKDPVLPSFDFGEYP